MSANLDFLCVPQFWRFYFRLDEDPPESFAESTLSLRCGRGYALELKIIPRFSTINLGLRKNRAKRCSEMGWWDDARWHPFALRWSELERLHQYWRNEPLDEVPPDIAVLLLAPFVGHGVEDRKLLSARRKFLADRFRSLNLFSAREVNEFSEHSVVLPDEENYQWSQDDELGWVFGGEYPCYSLRNPEHAEGGEGQFPFAEWAKIVDRLPAAP